MQLVWGSLAQQAYLFNSLLFEIYDFLTEIDCHLPCLKYFTIDFNFDLNLFILLKSLILLLLSPFILSPLFLSEIYIAGVYNPETLLLKVQTKTSQIIIVLCIISLSGALLNTQQWFFFYFFVGCGLQVELNELSDGDIE